MLLLRRFYALKALLIWLSLSVAVTAETSPKAALSNFDLVIPSNLSKNPQLRQLIAQNLPRKALVIGNAAYREGRLNNPVNDANAVAKALLDLGFDVNPRTNLNKRSMDEEIEQFSQELTEGGVGVFYYAGHGVQVKGENYLIPLEAQLKREKDVQYDAYPLGKVINAMEAAKTRINILIIDACRDNPFYRRWRSPNRGLTRVRGLEEVEATQGWVIAFATAPGEVAEDGEKSANSPFTYHLLRHLKNPNEDVVLMLRKVRKDVLQVTNGEQKPWVREFLVDSFSFNQVRTTPPSPTPPESTIESEPTPSSSPSPETTTPPSEIPSSTRTLISQATGVDYTQLRELLQARQWKEADQLTLELMLAAANRKEEKWLDRESIENFSCEDLRIIDQEWVTASDGKFGFSVQKKLWEQVGSPQLEAPIETWRQFWINIGWKTGTTEDSQGYLSYNALYEGLEERIQKVPEGHLPLAFDDTFGGDGGVRGLGVWIGGFFFPRTIACEL